MDFTTSTIPQFLEEGEVKCSKGLRVMLEEGVQIENITFSSDGQASLPFFDANGDYLGLQIGKVSSLYQEVKDAVIDEGIPLEVALQVITSNPSQVLKLPHKGNIKPGNDADIVLLNKDTLEIETVIALGKTMVENSMPIIKGTFE